jgi:acetyltransferase-like isoleucine patch superfamily enzyme
MKRLLVALLSPIARCAVAARPLGRAWAHAKFAAQIQGALDSSIVLQDAPEVHGTGRILLGKELFLYRALYLETQESGSIEIGDRVVISRGTHIVSFAGISIGDDCMIGEYVSIRDANHQFGNGKVVRDSGYEAKPIRIGRNVWIGRGVAVLPGVRIGDNAVVGANAVVTRDVPAGSVVVGIPAKPVALRAIA